LDLRILAKGHGRALVQGSALKRRAQIFVDFESGDTFGARNQMAFEVGGARSVQFAI
jgi:hypothetical protein